MQEVDQLKLHKKTVHVDKTKLDFKCEKCDFASYAKRYVLAHFQKVHVKPPELKHVCEYCGKRFLYPSHLKTHMNDFHGSGEKKKHRIRKKKIIIEKPGSIPCPHCKKLMSSDQKLQRHIQRLHGEKSFICPDCGKGFCEKKDLKQHLVQQKISCRDGSRMKDQNPLTSKPEKHKVEYEEFNTQTNPKRIKITPDGPAKLKSTIINSAWQNETQDAVNSIRDIDHW